jgi:hypothetical protein
MESVKQFLAGKKTYIVAGLLVALGVLMVLKGQTTNGMSVVLFGFGFVGLGDRANRHQSEILQAIQDGGRIAIDMQTGNKPALAVDTQAALNDAVAEAFKVAWPVSHLVLTPTVAPLPNGTITYSAETSSK